MGKSLAAILGFGFGLVVGGVVGVLLRDQPMSGMQKFILGSLGGGFAGLFGGSIGSETGGEALPSDGRSTISLACGILGGAIGFSNQASLGATIAGIRRMLPI
jgi:hypothetical protein